MWSFSSVHCSVLLEPWHHGGLRVAVGPQASGGRCPRGCVCTRLCGWCNCTGDRNLPKSGRKVRVAVTGPADKLSTHTHGHMNPSQGPSRAVERVPPRRPRSRSLVSFSPGSVQVLGRYICKDKSSMQPRFSAPQVTSGLCSGVTNTSLQALHKRQERREQRQLCAYF